LEATWVLSKLVYLTLCRSIQLEGCANSDVTVACWFLSDGSSVR